MTRYDADGRRIRTVPVPPLTDFPDRDDPDYVTKLLARMTSEVHQVAHYASECMQDHLDDDSVIRDMHDIIGTVGNLQSGLSLLGRRLEVPRG